MQTTLRIDDQLYRLAKSEAARQGVTLTSFLEEAIRLRLEQKHSSASKLHRFRIYEGKSRSSHAWEEINLISNEEQEKHDQTKLHLNSANIR